MGRGRLPMNENRDCPDYLGVYFAEGALYKVFKNVKRMPMGNPGFDFICDKGMIDVKSACKRKGRNGWQFHISYNTTPNYFLFLALDNRKDLNPLYIWLIPGEKLNHLSSASISPPTIHKWDEYRLDITKVAACCNTLR